MTALPDDVDKNAARHSDPLYLSEPFLQGGHTSEKANGTVTYVKYKGQLFCVTCAHIYDQQFVGNHVKWLTVHGRQRYIYQFGTYLPEGYKSHFISLRVRESSAPDIAIARVGEPFPQIHMEPRGKEPIDLDSWNEPNWSDLKVPVAFGYPTEHKTEADAFVQAPFVGVAAELTRPISTNDETFLMASTLETANDYYFSGMSGGAVYAVSDSESPLTAIGIVFEGTPGSAAEWAARDSQSFLTRSDIQIRAYLMTPRNFESWLCIAYGK
jgi:hypothetical protein